MSPAVTVKQFLISPLPAQMLSSRYLSLPSC